MTGRRTTRIAALGAGAVLTLGIFSAAPAGATDGAQAEATVKADSATLSAEAANAVNQTLDIVNRACADATKLGDAAASATTSVLGSEHGITVASQGAGAGLGLQVSLPALTDTLSSLNFPLLGSASAPVQSEPIKISCTNSTDGAGVGLSAAGVEALVEAIVPGVNVSDLIPSVDVSATAAGTSTAPAGSISATAAGSLPAATGTRASAQSPAVRASAAASPTTTSTTADAAAAPASTSVSGGTLARTGAGVGALGLLGTLLIGSGRLLGFGRKLFG